MNHTSLFLLGRQPALGLAELESLLGGTSVAPLGAAAVLSDTEPSPEFFKRLGGSVKLGRIIAELPSADFKAVEKFVKTQLAGQLVLPEEGKLQLGVSVYGIKASPAQTGSLGLNLKKQLKRSARVIVPQGETALSSAQILGNKMVGERGCEVVFYAVGSKTIVAQTVAEQDINTYTRRDRERPKRDTRVGMLPPKLAQIIINLTGPGDGRLLDPFCGTGVILQEALLTGRDAYGTDLEPRMIDYSQANLEWLGAGEALLETGDATDHQWQPPIDAVASEIYLGHPFATLPAPDELQNVASTTNLIFKKFLRNIHGQLAPGTRLCLAVPAWQIKKDVFKHLPALDLLEEFGYNQVRFEHVPTTELIYYRPDQIVARELVILTRR